ncbi:putative ribosomal protein L31e [Rosa chinensis]|uniref:Putative ribosomal protein L31e n=1 Tax=Rosa chinensis TaxID=74649 RepID=A0A2P6QMW9_ROSCH|nr:putative ribosomal protein L31e [Rosa chinensis]
MGNCSGRVGTRLKTPLFPENIIHSSCKKVPNSIKEIRKFAQKAMGTNDVRVDMKLNKQFWGRGIRSIPRRIRVRIARKTNE